MPPETVGEAATPPCVWRAHSFRSRAAFPGEIVVSVLAEPCPGPCRYVVQSCRPFPSRRPRRQRARRRARADPRPDPESAPRCASGSLTVERPVLGARDESRLTTPRTVLRPRSCRRQRVSDAAIRTPRRSAATWSRVRRRGRFTRACATPRRGAPCRRRSWAPYRRRPHARVSAGGRVASRNVAARRRTQALEHRRRRLDLERLEEHDGGIGDREEALSTREDILLAALDVELDQVDRTLQPLRRIVETDRFGDDRRALLAERPRGGEDPAIVEEIP